MATSGTVGVTTFTVQKLIDFAFREVGIIEQKISSEDLDVARMQLWLLVQTLSSKGLKLWNIDPLNQPIYERLFSLGLPAGTEDVLNVNLRTQTTFTGTATASEGDADNAFDRDLTTACTQTSADGSITLELTSATYFSTWGLYPNSDPSGVGAWTFVIEGSDDDATYVEIAAYTDLAITPQQWQWFDIQGVPRYLYYRMRATDGVTILDVAALAYQNTPRQIVLAKINRTDYSNQPDLVTPGRPNQFWYNRQRTDPVLELWPPPELQYTFGQITGYIQRAVEDVGALTDELEVPNRWYLAIVYGLAKMFLTSMPGADQGRAELVMLNAKTELANAWGGESDESTTYLRPRIGVYTR